MYREGELLLRQDYDILVIQVREQLKCLGAVQPVVYLLVLRPSRETRRRFERAVRVARQGFLRSEGTLIVHRLQKPVLQVFRNDGMVLQLHALT